MTTVTDLRTHITEALGSLRDARDRDDQLAVQTWEFMLNRMLERL